MGFELSQVAGPMEPFDRQGDVGTAARVLERVVMPEFYSQPISQRSEPIAIAAGPSGPRQHASASELEGRACNVKRIEAGDQNADVESRVVCHQNLAVDERAQFGPNLLHVRSVTHVFRVDAMNLDIAP